MKTHYRSITVVMLVSLGIILGGCVTAKQKKLDAGIMPMSDQELKTLFSKPIEASYYSNKRDMTVSLQYFPDGTQKIQTPKINDEGTYRIANGEQCSQWKTIRQGVEKCATWFRIGDKKYEVYEKNGAKNGTLTVK